MAAMALKNSSEMQCTPIASRLAPSSGLEKKVKILKTGTKEKEKNH